MKVIEQKILSELTVDLDDPDGEVVRINDCHDYILIDKQGAKQLIEILKEFVGDEVKRIAVDENGECLHFHTTFGRNECFDCGKKLKEFVNENG